MMSIYLTKNFSEIRDKEKRNLNAAGTNKRRLIINCRKKVFRKPLIVVPIGEPAIDFTTESNSSEHAI